MYLLRRLELRIDLTELLSFDSAAASVSEFAGLELQEVGVVRATKSMQSIDFKTAIEHCSNWVAKRSHLRELLA